VGFREKEHKTADFVAILLAFRVPYIVKRNKSGFIEGVVRLY
jgi:acetyl-CoA carboxylase carboxyltransferase component